MSIALPRKSNQIPIATDDEHFVAMANDPSIKEIPEGSTWNDLYSQNNSGFGSTQNINQSTSTMPVLTGAAPSNAASGAEYMENTNADWVNKKWRPAMGWVYMVVCVTDFIIFPIMWSILQAVWNGNVTNPWQPLTLQGAGLFHIAMGAVLGIAAYGRTKEKVEGRA